jgi:hypothetical protein
MDALYERGRRLIGAAGSLPSWELLTDDERQKFELAGTSMNDFWNTLYNVREGRAKQTRLSEGFNPRIYCETQGETWQLEEK